MRLSPGHRIRPLELQDLQLQPVHIPAADGSLTHLQFRRFAGCPVCNLHLRGFAARHEELRAAGVQEIAVFHSQRETMLPFQGALPFAVIADPEFVLYRMFGVEKSIRSLIDPRGWGAMRRGMREGVTHDPMAGEGGHLGQPADFLIAADGGLLACKYGAHADDQWSMDELLGLARAS